MRPAIAKDRMTAGPAFPGSDPDQGEDAGANDRSDTERDEVRPGQSLLEPMLFRHVLARHHHLAHVPVLHGSPLRHCEPFDVAQDKLREAIQPRNRIAARPRRSRRQLAHLGSLLGLLCRAHNRRRECSRMFAVTRATNPTHFPQVCVESGGCRMCKSYARRRSDVQKRPARILWPNSGETSASVDHKWAAVGQRFSSNANACFGRIADIRRSGQSPSASADEVDVRSVWDLYGDRESAWHCSRSRQVPMRRPGESWEKAPRSETCLPTWTR